MKPSFAKVAASAYVPHNQSPSSAAQGAQMPTNPTIQPNSPSAMLANTKRNDSSSCIPDSAQGQAVDCANESANVPSRESTAGAESIQSVLLTSASGDDSATLLSSSDGSVNKPASVDGKSVTSGTTFAMDEKESIQPDDSASIRAAPDEEDIFSAPGSVANGSRGGSESGARAFRDQLRELSALGAGGPLPQRSLPPQPQAFQNSPSNIPNGTLNQVDGARTPGVLQPAALIQSQISSAQLASHPPDEKLLEALQSPKDRLWVLKLEQDVLDFLKNEKETRLALPQCNAFYRMLAHRFADYYLLEHVVDQSGTAVHLLKTPSFRIPPPLSGLAISSTASSTPPPVAPTRKIMRRGEGSKPASGTSTGFNSENPSKTVSEAGESGSDVGQNDKKSKALLTREEREAKYKEARLRIFGDSEPVTTPEMESKDEDNDASRSSSASGKKKTTKKNRNYDNDGFEARSQFNPYYGQQFPVSGFGADGTFYPPYSGMMPGHFPGMIPNVSPPMPYTGSFPQIPQHDQQNQYGWQGAQGYPGVPPVPVMGMAAQNTGYDLSAEFNRSMQSFQNAPASAPNGTPSRPAVPPIPNLNDFRPQSQQSNQSWNPIPYDHSFSMPAQYGSNYNDNRSVTSGPMTQPAPAVPYAYGQMPNPYYNSPNRGMTHPVPGSFNRQQFNPQSQAFVPGGGMPAMRVPQPMPHTGSPNLGAYGTFSVVSPQPPRPSPPQPQFTSRPVASLPQPAVSGATNSVQTPQRPVVPQQQQQQQQRSPHPLPPNPLNSNGDTGSSIAKWGTPSHLPPKPPPPASMDLPEKFYEANGSMPAHTLSGIQSLYPNHVNGVRGSGGGK